MSSVHPRNDTRLIKELGTLNNSGFEASLIIADGLGSDINNGIFNIIDVGEPKNRLHRILIKTVRIFFVSRGLRAYAYHFHDPELIFCGILLKIFGSKVIFDVHEDVSRQILTKEYLSKSKAKILSKIYKYTEYILSRYFDGIICATEHISLNFIGVNKNTSVIFNYPLKNELFEFDIEAPANEVAYVGAISEERGLLVLLDALDDSLEVRLNLAGKFSSSNFKSRAQSHKNWPKVNYYGQLKREDVKNLLKKSLAGIVTFSDAPNHIDALPNKLFEYMSAGLPVIGSNFPLWVSIVDKNRAGICVNPKSSSEIANAIRFIKENRAEGLRMGGIGRDLVLKRFNWEAQERQFINFYLSL